MATLEFTEYRYPKAIYGALAPLPHGQEVATQQVAIGAAADASDPFDERTQLIVVSADEDCRIAIGTPASVEASNEAPFTRLLRADTDYCFDVLAGQAISVIEAVAA